MDGWMDGRTDGWAVGWREGGADCGGEKVLNAAAAGCADVRSVPKHSWQ